MDFNLIYFGYNLIRPPYFLQILMGLLFLNFDFFIDGNLSLAWFAVLLAFLFSLVVVIILKKTVQSILPGLWYSPVFFYHQIRALLKMSMNKNCILKTENSKVLYIDDVLKHGLS